MKQEWVKRRAKVLTHLQDLSKRDGVNYKAVVKSGELKNFSNDVFYPFRVDSDFYYLSGFTEPNSTLVLDPFTDHPYKLYVQPIDPEHTLWEGQRTGLSGAEKFYGADKAYDIDDFDEDKEPDSNKKSSQTKDVFTFVHQLRSIKSEDEIELMRKAARITVQAHRVTREILTPGIFEYELQAQIDQVFRSQGANGWAYPSIVASGENTCVLHYIDNKKKINKGDLVLIDAGCEYDYYASDVTRTHAAGGVMSKEQQDLYDVVLAAQQAAIDSVKPGASFWETHEIAAGIIGEGLADLGYIKDKFDKEQIKKYYMHSTGHSLGIDVHDVGTDKKTTKYVPGMVTTIEPGVYIKEKNIGIRIEDDVLVTNDKPENLTEALAK